LKEIAKRGKLLNTQMKDRMVEQLLWRSEIIEQVQKNLSEVRTISERDA
jgi:hypothetical protein